MRTTELLAFFGVVTAIVAGLHVYLGRRLVRPARLSRRGRALAWGALGASALAIVLGFLLGRFLGRSPALAALEWTGFVAMGVVLVLFPLVLARDAAALALELGARAWRACTGPEAPADPAARAARRRLLMGAGGRAALGLTGVASLGGMVGALRPPRVKRVRVPLPGLAPGLVGLRIAQLTDLHLGPTIRRGFLERVVADTNALAPDLIAVTGDLVDGSVDELAHDVAPLGALRARHGVYFVTGNHEYYWDALAWTRAVGELGLEVLNNAHRVVERGGARLVVAGVTDVHAARHLPEHASDPARALAGAPADADLRLLLAHQPRSVFAAEQAGVDLQLSGHTHGGQFLPWSWLIHLVQPVVAGLERVGRTWIYVSRGTGYWGPPMRTGAPAEITLLELVAADDETARAAGA